MNDFPHAKLLACFEIIKMSPRKTVPPQIKLNDYLSVRPQLRHFLHNQIKHSWFKERVVNATRYYKQHD